MNINPLTITKVNIYKPLRKENLTFKGHQEDVFVRQGEISQKELSRYYSKALNDFILEADDYIMYSPKITYRGLNKLVRKYSPNTKVKKFKSKYSSNNKSVAQFVQNLEYRNIGDRLLQEQVKEQIIRVNLPKKKDKESRARLLGSFVHEATHMFQYETKVKVTGGSYAKKYYDGLKTTEQLKTALNATGQLYYCLSKFEQNIFTLMSNFLNECHLTSYINLENFYKFIKTGHNMDFNEIVKFLLEDAYYEFGDNIIDTLGQNTITDYSKGKLARELEAYKKESEIMQKYSPNDFQNAISKFFAEVYEKVLNIVNNLELETIN